MALKIHDSIVVDDSKNISAGIVTGSFFYGDGSNLTNVPGATSFLVVGRSSNTTVLLDSGNFVVIGRNENITIPA
jgi:hypothetical protein